MVVRKRIAPQSTLLCIKIGFRFFDSSLVAYKIRDVRFRMEKSCVCGVVRNRDRGRKLSHENLNQFSAQRLEKRFVQFQFETSPEQTEWAQIHVHRPVVATCVSVCGVSLKVESSSCTYDVVGRIDLVETKTTKLSELSTSLSNARQKLHCGAARRD